MTSDTGTAARIMRNVIRAARECHGLGESSPVDFRVVFDRVVLAYFPIAKVGYGVWCEDADGARALVAYFDGAVA